MAGGQCPAANPTPTHCCLGTQWSVALDGLTLAALPRARGYPTLFPPPEGRGGSNVSGFSGNQSARGPYCLQQPKP